MAKAHELVDNFNDNAIDTTKWTEFGAPAPISERIRETNGRIEVRPRSTDTSLYSGFMSATQHDLTDSYAHLELVRAPKAIAGLGCSFLAKTAANDFVYFFLEIGFLRCFQRVGGVYTQLERVPYDPKAHRWLRLRERFGITYWETAPDGTTWTIVLSKPNPIVLTSVILQFEVGLEQPIPSPGVIIVDNFNVIDSSRSRRVEERRLSAREVRREAADVAAERLHLEHVNNNDEVNYTGRSFIGNYSKSLKHDSLGDPDPISYGTLLRALQSREPEDFERIDLATGPMTPIRLTNPQAGFAFDTGGPDPQERTLPPAPRFDSEQTAHEMGELYWMALARDIPFINWATQASTTGTVIKRAIDSLNTEFTAYGGTRPVNAQTLFRGIYPGEQVGPYVSQFLVKGNTDQRKLDGFGRDANEGFVSYGAQVIDQRIVPATPGLDYLKVFNEWLAVQNGSDKRGTDQFDTVRRFLRDLRGGATYVHFDQVVNAYYNAAWILMTEPMGNQLTFAGGSMPPRPQIDLEFTLNRGNPYDPPAIVNDSKTQVGFATFGPIHLLQVLSEVVGRALRAVWWQKWGVHRRLRPEEYGGRVHNNAVSLNTGGASGRTYPLDASILTSLRSGLLGNYFNSTAGYLLPQAFPEGAPTHPAYGAGHATGSGACVTILKAFFDESAPIENPLQASADGLSLVAYTGGDAAQMTVGGELNKLAGNIALFRNAAGVHWRTDYTESLLLGEGIAIGLLQEMSLGFNEDDAFFELTRFDGQKIRIYDGKVVFAP
jgi:hypothetical protein